MSDIMMKNGDIVISEYSDISVANENQDIVQTAVHNVLTIRGEMELHPDIGNDIYNSRNKLSSMSMKMVADYSKYAILQDKRVSDVTNIIVQKLDGLYATCDISFTLVTKYGDILSSNAQIII